MRLSGTSMAAPMVGGAAAILLGREPGLSPDTVKARLMLMKTAPKAFPLSSIATDATTGKVYPSVYDLFTVGAGYLDIAAALNKSRLRQRLCAFARCRLGYAFRHSPFAKTFSLYLGQRDLGAFRCLGSAGHSTCFQWEVGCVGNLGGVAVCKMV